MGLAAKLKSKFEALGYEFYYQSQKALNKQLDNADFSDNKTVIFAFLLSNSTLIDGKESADVAIFFAKKTDFDFDEWENDEIQQACMVEARNFEKDILSDNVFYLLSDTKISYFYDEFSINVTGVAVNITLMETMGISDCPEEEEEEEEEEAENNIE